jgi:hypothetical protein
MKDDNQERDDVPAAPGDGKNADDRAVEREIRRGRTFDLAAAIGRAGAGNLKGASPIPATRQALLTIEALLAARLQDPEGSLTRTLLVRLESDPPLLDRHRDHPEAALAAVLDRILAVATELEDLVRETDARWGRDYDERPRFEGGSRPAAADDPYTVEGVREVLSRLRLAL